MKKTIIKTFILLLITSNSLKVLSQGLEVETHFYFDAQRNKTVFGKDDIPNKNPLNGQAFTFAFWDDKMMVACRTEKTNYLSEQIRDTEITIHILDLEGNILNAFTVANPSGLGIGLSTSISAIDSHDLSATVDDLGNIFIGFRDHLGEPLNRKSYFFKYSSNGKSLWTKTFKPEESSITDLKPLKNGCVAIRNHMVEIYDESASPRVQKNIYNVRPSGVYVKDRQEVFYHSLNGNDKRGYSIEIENLIHGNKKNLEIGNQKVIDYQLTFDNNSNILVLSQTMEKRKLDGDKKAQKYYSGTALTFTPSGQKISNYTTFTDKPEKKNMPILITATDDKIINCSWYKFIISDFDLTNISSEASFSSVKSIAVTNQLKLEYMDNQKFIVRKMGGFDHQIAVVKYEL